MVFAMYVETEQGGKCNYCGCTISKEDTDNEIFVCTDCVSNFMNKD